MASTIYSLDDDILLHIFAEFEPYHPDLLHASHVNAHWRNLAIQTPWLWRHVYCNWAIREAVPFGVALARSKSAPLALVGRLKLMHQEVLDVRLRITIIRAFFDLDTEFKFLTDAVNGRMPNLRILRLVYNSSADDSRVLDWSFIHKNNLPSLLNLTVCGGHVPLEKLDLPQLTVARYEVLQAAEAGDALERSLARHPCLIDFWIALGLRGTTNHLSPEVWSVLGRLERLDFDSYFASTVVLDRLLFPACRLPVPYMMYELLYDAQDGPEAGDTSRWFQAAHEAHSKRVGLTYDDPTQIPRGLQPSWTVRFSRGDLET